MVESGVYSEERYGLGRLTEMALNSLVANTRRPSGNVASASIQLAPAVLGTNVKVAPGVGSWPVASQTYIALVIVKPETDRPTVTGTPFVTTLGNPVIVAVAYCQTSVPEEVCAIK